MESNRSPLADLQKVTRELNSYKIELEQTRGYLKCILQNSADMIFATEVGGILISFSKGGEKVLGYSWEEAAGRPIEDFAEDPASFGRVLATCQKEGYAIALDVHFRHKDGARVHCNTSLMDLTNREGQTVCTVGICQDITQWKRLQEDLVQVDRLAEIGRIAAGVAHEINNPVAVMKEASGWAGQVIADAKGLSQEDRHELEGVVAEIGNQTRRCRSITHRLLNFVRDSAPAKAELDVHELIRETVSFLKPELKHTTIEVDLNLAEGSLNLISDRRLLEQVFVNFITNAIHAVLETGQAGGRIEVFTVKTVSHVEISVRDNGVGIPEEEQKKVFTLFYTTKPVGQGTGLGLPICRNIVHNLGGDITFDSKVGVGTTFKIRIPVS
jgi:PAS domain S-box-containing protein